jgi:hypothetical protein
MDDAKTVWYAFCSQSLALRIPRVTYDSVRAGPVILQCYRVSPSESESRKHPKLCQFQPSDTATATIADIELWGWNSTAKTWRGAADVDPYIKRCRCCTSLGWSDMCEAVPKIYTDDFPFHHSTLEARQRAHTTHLVHRCRVLRKHCPKVWQAPDENKRKQDPSANNTDTRIWQPNGRS